MRLRIGPIMLVAAVLTLLAAGLPASADHETRPHTQNMHAKGHSPHPATFLGEPDGVRHVNSDIAFWGNTAFNGNYDGFRVIDIADPDNPVEISHPSCNGDQGDIVVWENILVRAWNSKKTTARLCDGQTVPAGFEGVHIFDVSDQSDPALVGSVVLPCGSHTLTTAGVSNGSLIVYSNNSSSAGCVDGTRPNDDPVGDFMDVIAVPVDNPAGASLIHREPLAGPTTDVRTGCHDAGVILGEVNKAVCASADTINVWDIGANATPGGSPEDPALLFTIFEPGIGVAGTNGRWHSTVFTWDGAVIVAGWEPGGGAEPECEATDPASDKSMFFYDATTGAKLGTVGPAAATERRGELHDPQLQPRPAPRRPRRSRQRQLPGRHLGHRHHRPGQPGHGRLVRPAAAPAGDTPGWRPAGQRARGSMVLVLVQQLHLRVGDHQGPEPLPAQWLGDGRSHPPAAPEPADAGLQPAVARPAKVHHEQADGPRLRTMEVLPDETMANFATNPCNSVPLGILAAGRRTGRGRPAA